MYKRILVTLDGSELSEEVLPYAEDMAEKMKSEVVLLRVSPPPQALEENGRIIAPVDEEMDRIAIELGEYLNRIAYRLRAKAIPVRTAVKFGDAAEVIVDYARESENGISLVAMCTHGRSGIKRWVYGSVAERVLRGSSVPVLLIRSSGAKTE
ncbi:MAG: universal stress protein [Chloroflexi bacterium]|nr:universal stress protein [Chloroflexota bacterium]